MTFQPRKIDVIFHGKFSDSKEAFAETAIGYALSPTIICEIVETELHFHEVAEIGACDNEVHIDLEDGHRRFDLNLTNIGMEDKIKKLDLVTLAGMNVVQLINVMLRL